MVQVLFLGMRLCVVVRPCVCVHGFGLFKEIAHPIEQSALAQGAVRTEKVTTLSILHISLKQLEISPGGYRLTGYEIGRN